MGQKTVVVLVILAIFACGSCICFATFGFQRVTAETVEGRVVDTYVKRYSESDRFFAVIEFDNGEEEVFQNTDSIAYFKFNSADLQQELRRAQESGQKCEFFVYGWRVQLTSGFRVVVEVKHCTVNG